MQNASAIKKNIHNLTVQITKFLYYNNYWSRNRQAGNICNKYLETNKDWRLSIT